MSCKPLGLGFRGEEELLSPCQRCERAGRIQLGCPGVWTSSRAAHPSPECLQTISAASRANVPCLGFKFPPEEKSDAEIQSSSAGCQVGGAGWASVSAQPSELLVNPRRKGVPKKPKDGDGPVGISGGESAKAVKRMWM